MITRQSAQVLEATPLVEPLIQEERRSFHPGCRRYGAVRSLRYDRK